MGSGRQNGSTAIPLWLQVAFRYLARRDHTVAQVQQFLKVKGASPAQTRQVIDRLSNLGYLDDRAYAQRWIEKRQRRSPMGKERLRMELVAKGVAESLAEDAVRTAFRVVDEETVARRILQARKLGGQDLTPGRIQRLLRQRGFEEETIDRMIGARSEAEGAWG